MSPTLPSLTYRLLLGLVLFLPALSLAETRSILMIHSYSQDYKWTHDQHNGFVSYLDTEYDGDLLFKSEYLDTKHRAYNPEYAKLTAQFLVKKYADLSPDLIYVTDDNATRFFIDELRSQYPETPVIFSGVNNRQLLNKVNQANIKGVFEEKDILSSLELINDIGGDTSKIALLGDDSVTHHATVKAMQQQLKARPDISIQVLSASRINDVREKIQHCQCRHIILTSIGNIRSENGEPMSLERIVGSITRSFKGSVFTMEDAYLIEGVVGGYVTSGYEQGKTAAMLALQVFDGLPVDQLQSPPTPNRYIIDEFELLFKGLTLPKALHESTLLINPLPGFYTEHRHLILTTLATLAALLIITLTIFVIFLARGRQRLRQASTELTQQKDMLLQASENLKMAQQIAQIGSWRLHHGSNELIWSDEIYRIFEIDQNTFGASYEAFLNAIHPEDRERVNHTFTQAVENKQPYEIDHRLLMPDGRIKYVHERGQTTYDTLGNPNLSFGTVQDITSKVETDKSLKQWGLIFENTIEAVVVTDADFNVVDVNKAYTQITGFSKQEVYGRKKLDIRNSDRHEDDFYNDIWETVVRTGNWSGEIWNRKKNGEPSPEWHSISTIRDEQGKITNYVSVFTDITSLKETEKKLEHLANHDPLTGLPNRMLLTDRLETAVVRAQRNRTKIAVLYLDLDRFKYINDTLGHTIGDLLLQEATSRLSSFLRKSDTLGRLGGDEFLIIIEVFSSDSQIQVLCDKLQQSMEQPFIIEGHKLFISASIGISFYPADATIASELVRNADSALSVAKKSGRNIISFYDAEITKLAENRLLIENSLRTASEKGLFELHYQAKVDLETDIIIGAEILLRLKKTDAPHFFPDQFIPVAEETGLIIPIGEWVLKQAVSQLSQWHRQGINLQIAVNVSAIQIQRGEILETLESLLKQYNFDPAMLEIEVTESVLIDFPEKAVEVLNGIRNLGFSLALDDFGTGFSSLSNLKRYPFSTIKVDKSFILDILSNPNDEAITRAVVAMGKSLDMKVVAEGAETHEQVDFLKQIQCEQAQGYFYSRPVPIDEFIRLCSIDEQMSGT